MDILCFSHLRWDFVYQRPQHLLTRFTPHFRVFYVEETVYGSESERIEVAKREQITIFRLHVRDEHPSLISISRQKKMLRNLLRKHQIEQYLLWFYTPMALPVAADLKPIVTIYDCMDELSAFRFAPPELKRLEKELMRKADVVFTGGHSLYAAKKHQHKNIHPIPSSIDKEHFRKARRIRKQPADQAAIPGPRFGFYGVLDERFDVNLIREVANRKKDWQFVLVGPVVKIDPASLPSNKNIHYLGPKTYDQLPHYLSGWDIAMVSFARNESTQYISPTKTPEYLSGGKPVISTPIKDVVETYGKTGLVHIVDGPDEFIKAATTELSVRNKLPWRNKVDAFLKNESWDLTVQLMREHIYSAIARKENLSSTKSLNVYSSTFIAAKTSLPAAS